MQSNSTTDLSASPAPPGPTGDHRPKPRLWPLLVVGLLATGGLYAWGLGTWPWDDDEVPSLLQMGLLDPSVHPRITSPDNISVRITRLMPVWYTTQGAFVRMVGTSELSARLLPAAYGVLTVVLAVWIGFRRRGFGFAVALLLLVGASPLLIWLSQQNRYYSLAVLLVAATLFGVRSEVRGLKGVVLCAVLAALAVFSHNVAVVVFGLAFCSACVCYPFGWVSRGVVVRSGVTAAVGGVLYFAYLRPLIGGWTGYGFQGANLLVSFVSHVGVPTLALSFLGAVFSLAIPAERKQMGWWSGLAVGGILFVLLAPWLMPAWNTRYGILFALPIWMTAALGVDQVGWRLRGWPLRAAWYCAVGMVLFPKLASYYVDGSRHDFRQAAQVVACRAAPDRIILSNMELETKYYLPKPLRPNVRFWQPGGELPPGECWLVLGTNAWDPIPEFSGRHFEVIAEIAHRRLDEQSYMVRVYRIGARTAVSPTRPAVLSISAPRIRSAKVLA